MNHMDFTRLFCLLLAAILLTGCTGAGETVPSPRQTAESAQTTAIVEDGQVFFTDDLGRAVTVDQHPQRVAALIGSFADVWCVAGGSDSLAATANDAWTSFDGLPLDGVTNLGAAKEVHLETLLAAEPDFILASCNTEADLALRPTLEALGIPTAYFQVSTFSEYLRMLEICTAITGDAEAYAEHGEAVQAQVEAAIARADGSRPKVLYIRVSGSGCKVKNSRNNVLGEMLAALDCENIADSETSLLEDLNLEVILAENPDFIFLVYQSADPAVAGAVADATLRADPAWQSLQAVQEGRCYVMDQSLYNLKPNARWEKAYEQLADILYPAA